MTTTRGPFRRALQLLLLGACLSCAKSDQQWKLDLESPDPHVRALAAIGLGIQSPEQAGVALPDLLKTIDRSELGLEQEAAEILAAVAPFHIEALLGELVSDELMSRDRKGSIKNALVMTGAPAAVPIVACLRGSGTFLVGDLGDVLLNIGEPAVPAIVTMLTGEQDTRLQNFAAFLLGRLGPGARGALPELRAATNSSDEGLRQAAVQAIQSIEGVRNGELRRDG